MRDLELLKALIKAPSSDAERAHVTARDRVEEDRRVDNALHEFNHYFRCEIIPQCDINAKAIVFYHLIRSIGMDHYFSAVMSGWIFQTLVHKEVPPVNSE